MFYIFLLFHILASAVLILTVLLQSGKAGDLASAFGGSSSQTAFGARGATTFLAKATTFAAITFMVTCLGLSILSRGSATSVLDELDVPAAQQTQPDTGQAAPAAADAQPAAQPAAAESKPAGEKPPDQN